MTDPDLRDPNLDRAYRETPRDEPPPEVDERIRAAARRAVGTRPQSVEQRAANERRRSWTSRWRLPLSVAATIVIAATLTVMVQEEDRPPRGDAGRGAARMDGAPREAEQPAAPAAASSPDAARDKLNQAPATASTPQSPAPAAAPSAPRAQPSGRVTEKSTAEPPTAPPRSEQAPQQKLQERAFEAQRPAAAESAPAAPAELEMRRQAPAPAASPPLAAPAPIPPAPAAAPPATGALQAPATRPAAKVMQEAAPAGAASRSMQRDRNLGDRPERASREASAIRSPEAWVEYIRSLRAQGRDAEATAELADLRRAYPDFKLPTDLGGPGQ